MGTQLSPVTAGAGPMTSVVERDSIPAQASSTVATAFAIAFVAWLPIQTTVALVAYEYAGVGLTIAEGILLLKDVVVAGAILLLLARHYRQLGLRWYDWIAVVYVALIAVYSFVPWVLGSELPLKAVAASARIFLMPVELYALGRLLMLSRANLGIVVKAFLAVSAVAAGATLLAFVFTSPDFWTTVLDLPRFIREVQGYPAAVNLTNISVLTQYGDGEAILRATWPFTHPVGTGHYFVLPFGIALAGTYAAWERGVRSRELALWAGLVILFVGTLIGPISRGSWIAAAIAALACGIAFRRVLVTATGIAVVALFIVLVPPFSLAVWGAVGATDPSTVAHGGAIQSGVTSYLQAPLGLGMGQADHPGAAYGGDESAAVGENLYLALLVSVGPLGTLAFFGWLVGMIGTLLAAWRGSRPWLAVALLACVLGYLVSASTASPLMRFTTAASFWLLLGMVVASVNAWQPHVGRLRVFRRSVDSPQSNPAT